MVVVGHAIWWNSGATGCENQVAEVAQFIVVNEDTKNVSIRIVGQQLRGWLAVARPSTDVYDGSNICFLVYVHDHIKTASQVGMLAPLLQSMAANLRVGELIYPARFVCCAIHRVVMYDPQRRMVVVVLTALHIQFYGVAAQIQRTLKARQGVFSFQPRSAAMTND